MFALRRCFNQLPVCLYRTYATGSPIKITHEDSTGISTISMAYPPANTLNVESLSALKSSFIECQKNRSKGIILTSSLPNIFSAGLDLFEMYNRTEKQLTEFWRTLQDMWMTLYGLEMPVAAAINGSSPGAGCLLAVSSEYRVFVEGKYRIGLNETQIGLVAPPWFRDIYIQILGYRQAELALLRGTLFLPNEALELGMVDELASDSADAIKKCENYIKSFKNMPCRSTTKLELRKSNLLWLKENQDVDIKRFLKAAQSPAVQAGLKSYIESLKKK